MPENEVSEFIKLSEKLKIKGLDLPFYPDISSKLLRTEQEDRENIFTRIYP